MPQSDSDVTARAGEVVADVYRALTIMDPVPPDDAEYMAVTQIAAAGLALRAAAMHPRDGAALGIVGGVTPQSALDAFDAAIRAALGTDADAGAVAGEAGT